MFSNISLSTIISMIQLGMKIAEKIATYIERKQLMDAGAAKEQNKNLKDANDAISKAVATRRNANRKYKSNGMPDDYKHWRK